MKRQVKRRTAFILERHPIYDDTHSTPTYRVSVIIAEDMGEGHYEYKGKHLRRSGNELHGNSVRYVILASEDCTQ